MPHNFSSPCRDLLWGYELLNTCHTYSPMDYHKGMCARLLLVLLLNTCKLLKCMSQKLHHIIYQRKFSFHSCGSYVLGNTKIKSSALMYPTCVTNSPPTRSL
jgi:hypothetical protein